jgi:hypothetical protein
MPMEFYASFFGIPRIIPNNSKEFQRIPKTDPAVIPAIISPSPQVVNHSFKNP